MGEPLYNFDNVRDALKLVMDGDGLALSKRRITLSTSGVVPMMARCGRGNRGQSRRLAPRGQQGSARRDRPDQPQVWHRGTASGLRRLSRRVNARRITFEYVMLKDKNDSDEDARELVRLIKQYKLPAKVNLIPFNPWPGAPYECSSPERIRRFSDIVFEAWHQRPGAHPARARHRCRLRPAEKTAAKKQEPRRTGPAGRGKAGRAGFLTVPHRHILAARAMHRMVGFAFEEPPAIFGMRAHR
jgi:23S rRNA (adenine2503-C2)-methyltransferase